MKTVVLSFKDRTNNTKLDYELDFVKFLNQYTMYADQILVLSKTDENGLIEALNGSFDCAFILSSDKTSFYFPSVFDKIGIKVNNNGFTEDGKCISVVPEDYKDKYSVKLVDFLKTRFGISFEKVTFKLYGISKKDIEDSTLKISSKYPTVYFNVCTENLDSTVSLIYTDTAPKSQVDRAVREFIKLHKNSIYAEDDITLSQRFLDVVKLRKQKVCTAESMTGGRIASKIVSVSGASDVFYEGLVTYNTLAKERRLDVLHSTVIKCTVVSEEVAYEMAKGLLSQNNCTLAIAITGYAGSDVYPSKDDGLCYIAIGTQNKIQVYKYKFNGKREENIESASNAGIYLAIKTVENLDSL